MCVAASIQDRANQQVDDGLKRAVVSFAAAKTLNAAISVAQGTKSRCQPVGVGLTVTVGQALDPLNDLVEQFAGLMLTASVAFGVQKVCSRSGLSGSVDGGECLAALWALLYLRGTAPFWLSRVLFVLVLVRFAIPVITIGSDRIFQGFLADNYQQAQQSLDVISANASKPVIQVPGESRDRSVWDKLKNWGDSGGLLDVKARVAELREAVDKATDHIIDLMVVFVMQTIIVPIILLWALIKIAGGVLFWRPLPATSGAGT